MSIYSFQGIKLWEEEAWKKFFISFDDHLPATFSHPLKTMEDCDMLSFLHGVLQVYLEFWNSSNTFEEYVPHFIKPLRCVQDEYAHMLTELLSLLKNIRSCQYLPSINMVEKWMNYRN